jgi:predicted N-acetyltransferase YhbS
MNVLIRPAGEEDIQAVLHVERQAFGREGEAQVVRELLADSTARPLISLLAFEDEKPVGHILLTSAALEGEHSHAKILLLAPVFVLGHPEYYIRYRFTPAGQHGFETPYPILPENADAWMVTELKRNKINEMNGRVLPAEVFRRPEHWRE